jgi:FSR family fosmidomycin resistance protein-like MFS transporter
LASTDPQDVQILAEDITTITIKETEENAEFPVLKAALISSAHLINDTYSSFVSPLIPFLIADLSLMKVQASLFLFFFQGLSILQPFIGHLADRFDLRKVALFAPAVTGIFLSLLGNSPSFPVALIYCILAGVASATMHAILPALLGSYSGKHIGKGISMWMSAGDIGFIIGPLLLTFVVATYSTKATPWLMIGGIVISILLNIFFRNEPYQNETPGQSKPIPIQQLRAFMLPLAGMILMRSILRSSLSNYLPVFLTEEGAGVWVSGISVSIMQGFGLLGIVLGGIGKDRYGYKSVLLISVILSGFGMLLFVFSTGLVRILSLTFLGISLLMMMPAAMATVQEFFPENRSFANGIYLALMFGINAFSGILAGFMYDNLGGHTTFLIGGLLTFLAIPFVLKLPAQNNPA